MTDSDLLLQFTQGSEKAFADLVQRHVDFVFAAALRHVAGDRHCAEDVVQKVFIDLSRKAPTLTQHPSVAGWLYSSTRYTAINTLRNEQRRSLRERQSDVMNTTIPGPEPRWDQIRPVIDEALQELDEGDRQSVLLRFFEQQPFAEIGAQLGVSENAAQKRVERALDRLNVALVRRGISSTATALSLALAESCVAASPTLAGAVTSAALANAAGLGSSAFTLAGALKITIAATTVGMIGWAGFNWLRPTTVAPEPAPQQATMTAQPAQSEVKPSLPAVTEAPKVVEQPRREGVQGHPVQSTPVAPPPPPSQIYSIKPGDTLAKIAAETDLTPNELILLNPGIDWRRLRVGQQIQVR